MCFRFFNHASQSLLCCWSVAYKYLLKSRPELEITPKYTFDCFIGAVLVALIAFFILAQQNKYQLQQFSGDINIPKCCGFRCRLFFWNKGVTKVNTGLVSDYEQCVNSSRINYQPCYME
jgi:hypothetical protein